MDTFTNKFDQIIRPYMDKIDQVRSILSGGVQGITFPTVVVVGDQSSGKSTLLEALSLVELPKGSGIVTRCPLVLRLRTATERRVYRILGQNEKTLLNEDDLNILHYIEEETAKLAGHQKNVVKDLIELQVEDPNVRDLTVVDLPGIARNPVADQPRDIHAQTTNLIKHFIRQEGCVILCVFPANVDVATVESFTLAREVDPSGTRTIGVITKSDLAPNADDLCRQLLMENENVLQLKLGFIAVRNRTADEKMTLKEAREREKHFFRGHLASSVVGSDCLGIDALINRLADLYADRVQKTFPQMRKEVQHKLDQVREQLSKFPEALDSPIARLGKYHELVDFFVENVLKVRLSLGNEDSSLVNILHGKFSKFEKILITQKKALATCPYFAKVKNAMSTCAGEQLPNFLPNTLLKRFVEEKINELWSTTKSLVNDCFSTTLGFLSIDDGQHKSNYLLQKLQPAFSEVVRLHLNEQKKSALDQLRGLIDLEKNDPYTMNNSYMEMVQTSKADRPANSEVDNDDQGVDDMIDSIRSYWEVVRRRFLDYATLSIRDRFAFSVCNGVRDRLRNIPSEQCDFVDGYLADDAATRAQRGKLQQTYDQLHKCLEILGGRKLIDGNSNVAIVDDNELDAIFDKLNQNEEEKIPKMLFSLNDFRVNGEDEDDA
ncbi:interferon-induced GTP-binding protein Mx-like [Bradysia coprophila]|uniref:interferon-induced GTP-binding protein Mx-like n=1 Tax=Bradysia coprophila TaxID=38358 RepID=UPI00187DD17A|nr:interferon-induced GTP-binding protein Mx-like [Bradysia coprophila]